MRRLSIFVSLWLAFFSANVWAEKPIVMDVQLPFPDGDRYQCTQNSNDTPTHNADSTRYDLDFSMPVGTIVVAAADGVFYREDNPKGFGCYGHVDHGNGYWTIYGHLDGFIAQDEQEVVAGQPIAYSGGINLPCAGKSTGAHLHFGVHSGSNEGVSERMNVYAYNATTKHFGDFATGLQTDARREFVCGLGNSGHIYESRPIGSVFGDYTCRSLTGSNGILCWTGNPTTCEDGDNHVRYYHTSQGYQSESGDWSWCYNDAGDGGQANVLAFLEGNYGGVGGDGTPSTPPIGTTPKPKSGKRADLYPDYDIKRNGSEISANCDTCSGMPVTVGEDLEYKGQIKVANDSAGKWKRKDSVSKVEGTFFYKIPGYQNAWKEFCTQEYSISKLDKGATIQGTCHWNVPNVPGEGYVLETDFCPDRDDIIWESDETNKRDHISDPIDDNGINCSRTERNYIRIPNYPPTGAVDGGDCNDFSGWAKDDNTSDPIRIRIYANGEYVGQPLANQYRSDVGNHGFTWVTPEGFKDGGLRTITFFAVDVPDGTETFIGREYLVCVPPPPPPAPPPPPVLHTKLYPDFDIYNTSGHEISGNCDGCFGEAVDVGQHIRPKLWTRVASDNAGKWKRNGKSNTIEGPIWWKIEGKTKWKLLGSGEYTIGKLNKGARISETHDFTVPNYPGGVLVSIGCVDGDDEIWEEGETSDQNSISSPDDSKATGDNCSRMERNYIRER